jgi:C-terminal processing protease CtpA/Prc
MKKLFILFILFVLQSCVSIQKYNAQIYDPISVKDIKEDITFIHKKLNDYHPELHLYIDKVDLDRKFDSLSQSITEPLNSYEFYKKLVPVLNTVRQGHMHSIPRIKKNDKKEQKNLKSKGSGPISQFEFEIFDNQLFIVQNKSNHSEIAIGTEVLSINGLKAENLLNESRTLLVSDGFNETLIDHYLDETLFSNFTFKFGIQDSILYEFKWKDSLFTKTIKREKIIPIGGKKSDSIQKKWTDVQKDSIKNLKKFKNIHGFDEIKNRYNRNLSFKDQDSAIAVMTIHSFTLGDFKTFYNNSFQILSDKKTPYLIIDLRDNGGGRLSDCTELYSYLTKDSIFTMIDQQKVTKRTSMLHVPYLKGGSFLSKSLRAPFAPIFYSVLYFKTQKNASDEFFFSTKYSKPKLRKSTAYEGKVFVLINGGSFSASSIISSNLKGTERAFFVGEETGGAYNGTVAGTMPYFKLPHSKVEVRFGLQLIAPSEKTKIYGRGIFPNKTIKPILQDRIENNDPEMNWIIETIKKEKTNQSPD